MLLRAILLFVTSVHALDVINYGAFTQTATYSIANQLGFFKAFGLNVVFNQVPNSTFAYAQVLSGASDILTGTIDNNVNLRLNSNMNVTVLGQLDQGPDLVLASSPNITSIAQLKGKPLIIDSPVSGYAILLRDILSLNGLSLENGDFFFQAVGGTNIRFADLIAGQLPNGTAVFATILVYPFTTEGQVVPTAQRPNILARASDIVNPFASSAFTTRQSALTNQTEKAKLVRFMSAIKERCAVGAIQKQLNVTADVAQLEYTAATNAETGEVSPGGNFTVNEQGLLNVIAVREKFNGFPNLPADFDFDAAIAPGEGKMIDYSIRDEAVAIVRKLDLLLDLIC